MGGEKQPRAGGTVNISRSLWDDPAFRNEPFSEREAWVWMVAEASWKPREKRIGSIIVSLNRGEFAASIRFLSIAFQWHRNKVDRFLKRLSKCNMIRAETGSGVNVITICNYSVYQSGHDNTGTAPGQHRDNTGTNDKKGERRVKEKSIDILGQEEPDPKQPCEATLAFNAWNAMAEANGLPKAAKLTDTRKGHLARRIEDIGSLDAFVDLIETVPLSPFLAGKNDRRWKASLDFIAQPSSFEKLRDGVYHGGILPKPPAKLAPDAIALRQQRAAALKAYQD